MLPLPSLLLLSLISLITAQTQPPVCTDQQFDSYSTVVRDLSAPCEQILGGFSVCTDQCYAHFKEGALAAPECTISGQGASIRVGAEGYVKQCESARASLNSKYTPQPQQGLTNCTDAEETEWLSKYGYLTTTGNCSATAMAGGMCSDSCLKEIEEGVEAAKVCRLVGDYSSREIKKYQLVGCLQARSEDLTANKVLQSFSNATNQSSNATATITTPSPTTASSASTVGVSLAIGVSIIVGAMLTLG